MKERLSRFRSFWVFPLLSIALLVFLPKSKSYSAWDLVAMIGGGVALWSLLEYGFHRFLLHARFQNPTLNDVVNASHLRHHHSPRDRDIILVQLPFALTTSVIVYSVLWALTRNAFEASALISGIWLGFLYYEAVHYRVHMSLSHSPLLQQQRRAHFYHHFSNSEKCYGVTSPIWDYVFGTMRREAQRP
jgi:sterol desaturase/sphingolipid hydroxylase (fatty acid hydroxylase superfamily)